ncbi:hypothetical protein PMAYCL1PPCAC_07671, partial [Pristionchus mayeri]
ASPSGSSSSGSTEGEISTELKQARMITDDLAYRDDDDYTPMEFIKKLPHSNVFYLLCMAFTITVVSGVMDHLSIMYIGQLYAGGELLVRDKLIIHSIAGIALFANGKWHRCRWIILLLAIALLTICIRLMALRLEMNACSITRVLTGENRLTEEDLNDEFADDQKLFGLTFITVYVLTVEMLRSISLLYVAELTPSLLRMPAVCLVSVVNSASNKLTVHLWSAE